MIKKVCTCRDTDTQVDELFPYDETYHHITEEDLKGIRNLKK
jgi:hypothetical protein